MAERHTYCPDCCQVCKPPPMDIQPITVGDVDLVERVKNADLRPKRGLMAILERYCEIKGVGEVSKPLGICRDSFIREFSAAFGISPKALMINLRVEHAYRLLRDTDIPLEKIAEAVGYSDRSALARAIRQKVGKTPREIRLMGPTRTAEVTS